MNGRRQFLKGAGLFSALLAGATVTRSATAATAVGGTMLSNNNSAAARKATANAVKQIEEHNVSSLALTQTYGTIAPPPPPQADVGIGSGGNFTFTGMPYNTAPLMVNSCGNVSINGSQKQFVPGTEKRTEVKMAPGPDGELYININGNWKKVVTA